MNLEAENPEEWQKEEQERIDIAEPLSEEQQQEKESLLQQVRLSPVPGLFSQQGCSVSINILHVFSRASLTGVVVISTSL